MEFFVNVILFYDKKWFFWAKVVTLPFALRSPLIRQWLVQLALKVPLSQVPFSYKWFSKARYLKRSQNLTLNENSLGNLLPNLVTADRSEPSLVWWLSLLEYGLHWMR